MGHTQLLSVTPLRWIDEGGLPRATNNAWRDTTAPHPTVLVPVTQIVRRVGYFLRLCECGHAGRANFHNGDEGAAFELIAAKTWTCGFCQTHQPNPGRDDEEFTAATKAKGAA